MCLQKPEGGGGGGGRSARTLCSRLASRLSRGRWAGAGSESAIPGSGGGSSPNSLRGRYPTASVCSLQCPFLLLTLKKPDSFFQCDSNY